MESLTCTVPGCTKPRATRDYCGMHYARWKRTGDVGPATSMRLSPAARFAAKTILDERGCILWIGGTTPDGYGKFYVKDAVMLAHRWAYQQANGPVPVGLELDHLCRVRNCVNVEHLEAVTRQVNATRGVGFAGLNARKTHCHRGHEFTPENTRRKPSGGRVCRACDVIHTRNYLARRAARSEAS